MQSPHSLLVLCTGNICRSPMAEVVLQREVAKLQLGTLVYSRGLAAPLGAAPHTYTASVCAAKALPLEPAKRAAAVEMADLLAATLILVMDSGHKHEVQRRCPQAGGKTWLLGHWEGKEIADPLGGELAAFENCWTDIEAGARSWAARLKESGLLTA